MHDVAFKFGCKPAMHVYIPRRLVLYELFSKSFALLSSGGKKDLLLARMEAGQEALRLFAIKGVINIIAIGTAIIKPEMTPATKVS